MAAAPRVRRVDPPVGRLVAAGPRFALFAACIVLSGTWSHAPGRAVVEFGRALMYLLVLVLCASLAPREHRLAWALRGWLWRSP